jgi:hypothetical protein
MAHSALVEIGWLAVTLGVAHYLVDRRKRAHVRRLRDQKVQWRIAGTHFKHIAHLRDGEWAGAQGVARFLEPLVEASGRGWPGVIANCFDGSLELRAFELTEDGKTVVVHGVLDVDSSFEPFADGDEVRVAGRVSVVVHPSGESESLRGPPVRRVIRGTEEEPAVLVVGGASARG